MIKKVFWNRWNLSGETIPAREFPVAAAAGQRISFRVLLAPPVEIRIAPGVNDRRQREMICCEPRFHGRIKIVPGSLFMGADIKIDGEIETHQVAHGGFLFFDLPGDIHVFPHIPYRIPLLRRDGDGRRQNHQNSKNVSIHIFSPCMQIFLAPIFFYLFSIRRGIDCLFFLKKTEADRNIVHAFRL